MTKEECKRGLKVKFRVPQISNRFNFTGQIVKPVPKDATKGAARLTVKDMDGKLWHPFPRQCKVA